MSTRGRDTMNCSLLGKGVVMSKLLQSGARKMVLSLLCIVALAATQLATAPPTAAAPTQPTAAPLTAAATNECGYVTCSLYFSRNETKAIDRYLQRNQAAGTAGIATAAAAACAATGIGAVVAALCAGAGAIYGGRLVDQVHHAATTNGCLRIRYTRGGAVVGLYSDHSKYCRTDL